MTGTQWPPGYRLHAVSEDFLENPNVAFYEARGEAGHLEMLARRGVLKVIAAHDFEPTAPPSITHQLPTTNQGTTHDRRHQ